MLDQTIDGTGVDFVVKEELDISELKSEAPVEVGQCYLVNDATTTAFLDELETEVGDTSSFRKALTDFLDAAQLSLDIAGLIPGVGLIPDVANAVISTCRGNFGEACLSLAAAVPVVGQGVTAGKLAVKAGKTASLASKVVNYIPYELKGLSTELQIRLSKMEIPKIPLVPGGGLIQHEINGGHALLKHVGRTIEQLKARFLKQPYIKGSSSFDNLMDAEKYVSQTLTHNKIKIDDWLLEASLPNLEITKQFNNKVGIAVKPDLSVYDSKEVVVRLKKDIKSELGYVICTAYPKINK